MAATRISRLQAPALIALCAALTACSDAGSSDGGVLDASAPDGSLVVRDAASGDGDADLADRDAGPEAGSADLPDGFLESTSCEGLPEFLVARNVRPPIRPLAMS